MPRSWLALGRTLAGAQQLGRFLQAALAEGAHRSHRAWGYPAPRTGNESFAIALISAERWAQHRPESGGTA